jgi:hypothetical protein
MTRDHLQGLSDRKKLRFLTLTLASMRKPLWRVFKHEKPKCGAKTGRGTPCQAPAAWDKYRCGIANGRCRMHGGLSTGPRTEEGLWRVSEAQKKRWAKRRAERGSGPLAD